jgi:type I restriction enzyme S subunit
MELMEKQGYKVTEVGLIPQDWNDESIGDLASISTGGSDTQDRVDDGIYPFFVRSQTIERINKYSFDGEAILTSGDGVGVGKIFHYVNCKFDYHQRVYNIHNYRKDVSGKYLFYQFSTKFYDRVMAMTAKSSVDSVRREMIADMKIPLPPTLEEQKAIATALSNVDELITNLDQLITKKKAIKQGAMQQLLTPPHKGGKRLEGFSGEWLYLTIEQVADSLDNLRVPLNGEQRNKMQGDIPYCGANGIVDYVNDFVIDDDIILIAEDGGYFDEYKTRPIAYRMIGKCWVNNHAHILKSKKGYNQGFLYFSLVHKNILDYINGGTRAKLNKGEMTKIECWFPNKYEEQKAIAEILSNMDLEIEQLEVKKAKYQSVKQGMMQELLTGKTRLI